MRFSNRLNIHFISINLYQTSTTKRMQYSLIHFFFILFLKLLFYLNCLESDYNFISPYILLLSQMKFIFYMNQMMIQFLHQLVNFLYFFIQTSSKIQISLCCKYTFLCQTINIFLYPMRIQNIHNLIIMKIIDQILSCHL